jgi:hypothetical protein
MFICPLFTIDRSLTIGTNRPHMFPQRPVSINSYLELFPRVQSLSIQWTCCVAGTDAALPFQEVSSTNVSSTSVQNLAIHLDPYLIVNDVSGRPIAHAVSWFRTMLEWRGILENLVLPNL